LRRVDVFSRTLILATLCLGTAAGSAWAASKTVYRCTGANGQVTLSDRRCPEDDAQAKAQKGDAQKGDAPKGDAQKTDKADAPKADTAKASASQASSAVTKVCGDTKEKLADRRRQKNMSDAERKALRQLEDEHRRTCGA